MSGSYHADCVGITPNIEQEIKDQYICPSCAPNITLVNSDCVGPPTSSVIYPCKSCVDFQWGDIKMVKLSKS